MSGAHVLWSCEVSARESIHRVVRTKVRDIVSQLHFAIASSCTPDIIQSRGGTWGQGYRFVFKHHDFLPVTTSWQPPWRSSVLTTMRLQSCCTPGSQQCAPQNIPGCININIRPHITTLHYSSLSTLALCYKATKWQSSTIAPSCTALTDYRPTCPQSHSLMTPPGSPGSFCPDGSRESMCYYLPHGSISFTMPPVPPLKSLQR